MSRFVVSYFTKLKTELFTFLPQKIICNSAEGNLENIEGQDTKRITHIPPPRNTTVNMSMCFTLVTVSAWERAENDAEEGELRAGTGRKQRQENG